MILRCFSYFILQCPYDTFKAIWGNLIFFGPFGKGVGGSRKRGGTFSVPGSIYSLQFLFKISTTKKVLINI